MQYMSCVRSSKRGLEAHGSVHLGKNLVREDLGELEEVDLGSSSLGCLGDGLSEGL